MFTKHRCEQNQLLALGWRVMWLQSSLHVAGAHRVVLQGEGLVRSPLLCVCWPSPNAPWCLKCGGKGSVHAESKHREWLWSIFVPLSAESDLCLSSCEDQEGWSYALVGKWGPGEGC